MTKTIDWMILGAAGLLLGEVALAQEGHESAPGEPEPVLIVGDFDGDGDVTEDDVRRVKDRAESGEYIAFFDRNADGTLDEQDVEITREEIGRRSEHLDRELAALFHSTERFRDRARAIEEGFIPFTQHFSGHGSHWGRHPDTGAIGYGFRPGHPFGLNYDEDGRLWGIFYYIGSTPARLDGTRYPPRDEFEPMRGEPEGFSGDRDHWHFHAGACFRGLNYENPTLDPEELEYTEGISPSECLPELTGEGAAVFSAENARWNPKFQMLHVWLYELNPNGTFAMEHPDPSPNAPPLATSMPHGKVDPLDPHPDYSFEGGTLCAWLYDAGMAPGFYQG